MQFSSRAKAPWPCHFVIFILILTLKFYWLHWHSSHRKTKLNVASTQNMYAHFITFLQLVCCWYYRPNTQSHCIRLTVGAMIHDEEGLNKWPEKLFSRIVKNIAVRYAIMWPYIKKRDAVLQDNNEANCSVKGIMPMLKPVCFAGAYLCCKCVPYLCEKRQIGLIWWKTSKF